MSSFTRNIQRSGPRIIQGEDGPVTIPGSGYQGRGRNLGVHNPRDPALLSRQGKRKGKAGKAKPRTADCAKPKVVYQTSTREIKDRQCKLLDSGATKAVRRELHKARMEEKANARIANYHGASTPSRAASLFKYFGLERVQNHKGKRECARRVRQMEARQ